MLFAAKTKNDSNDNVNEYQQICRQLYLYGQHKIASFLPTSDLANVLTITSFDASVHYNMLSQLKARNHVYLKAYPQLSTDKKSINELVKPLVQIEQAFVIPCKAHELPFGHDIIDFIFMPFLLNQICADSRQALLREASQCIKKDGSILIMGINPSSFYGRRCRKMTSIGHHYQSISIQRLNKELADCHLEIIGSRYFHYSAAVKPVNASIDEKDNWVDKVGDRWWPTFANGYALLCKPQNELINLSQSRHKQNKAKQRFYGNQQPSFCDPN